MNVISKTSKKTPRPRKVKVSQQVVSESLTPAAKIEAFLLKEGFHPMTVEEEQYLKKHGLLGMPNE